MSKNYKSALLSDSNIWLMPLSRQTVTLLEKEGLFTIEQIEAVGIQEIAKVRGIGPGKVKEIRAAIRFIRDQD
ncbi:hypothetical protein BpsM61_00022 [Bacillus phage vB_BpsM-61]|nr:hypothetical protein BpsM61_00022 [Bacillus phage vB_BpsM-61]